MIFFCLAAIEARGVQPLLDMLRRLGGWPVLDGKAWNDRAFSWEQSVYKFRRAGYSVDYFLDFSISVDVKNSTKRIIDVRLYLRHSRPTYSHKKICTYIKYSMTTLR
jgi:hypothetical protein